MKSTVIFDMTNTIYYLANSGQVKPMPEAIATFLEFYEQGYKIVIISNLIIQRSREILQELLTKHGLTSPQLQQLFKKIDILTMQYFGTKHSVDSWEKALQPYTNIDYIFEDGEEKLKAAGKAAQNLGHEPELYLSIKEFAG